MNVEYISGVPGLGKTHWCVLSIKNRMLTRQGLSVYVAPTRELLNQFKDDLETSLIQEGRKPMCRHIAMIVSTPGKDPWRLPIHQIVLRYLTKELEPEDYLVLPKLTKRTVLLITHQTFYRLRSDKISKKILKSSHVFFDEAKKSILSDTLNLGNLKCARYLDKVCNIVKDKGYYKVLSKGDIDVDRDVRKLLTLGLPLKPLNTLTRILEYLESDNVDVYIQQSSFQKRNTIQYVTLPTKVFQNYGKVTIMAAHLEQSQMYNMMRLVPGINLINVTTEIPWYKERKAAILRRYSEVTIIPLTLQTSPISLKRLGGYMLPKNKIQHIARKLSEAGVTQADLTKALVYVAEHKGAQARAKARALETGEPCVVPDTTKTKVLTKESKQVSTAFLELQKRKNKVEVDPIDWLLKNALKVKRHLRKKDPAYSGKSLVFTNKRYEDKVKQYEEDLTYVTTHCFGINSYADVNIATYLAAINPNIGLSNFMKAFLGPNYDSQEDFTSDTCLQCVARTSVRDINSRQRVVFIVPDLAIAEMLKKSMLGKPKIDTRYAPKLGNMVFMTDLKSMTETPEDIERHRKREQEFKKTSIMFRDRNRLYGYRYRLRAGDAVKYTEEEIVDRLDFVRQCIADRLSNEEYVMRQEEYGIQI